MGKQYSNENFHHLTSGHRCPSYRQQGPRRKVWSPPSVRQHAREPVDVTPSTIPAVPIWDLKDLTATPTPSVETSPRSRHAPRESMESSISTTTRAREPVDAIP